MSAPDVIKQPTAMPAVGLQRGVRGSDQRHTTMKTYSLEAETLVHTINAALKRNAPATDVYLIAENALEAATNGGLKRASQIISETDMAQYPNEWEVVESINNSILKEMTAHAAVSNVEVSHTRREQP